MKRLNKIALVFAIVLVVSSFAHSAVLTAQADITEQDAIETAAAHPIFASGLEQLEGWTAAAYDTRNIYNIWRVQFWDSTGEELAWADVNPVLGRVYSYEAHFGASEAQTETAYDHIREFLSSSPDILELVEDPSMYDIYTEYDGWNRWWGVYMDIGEDSLYLIVRFDRNTPDSFDNPELVGVYFPNVISYDEWHTSMQSQAVAVAFETQDVADVLEGKSWTTHVETTDDGLWLVTFLEGDTALAEVVLDNAMQAVVDFHVNE